MMRKFYTFILLSLISTSVFSAGQTAIWRWRNNDGNEKTATWKAAQNLPITISTNQPVRLRLSFYFMSSIEPTLSYSQSKSGPYVTIKNDDGSNHNAFALAGDNSFVTHWEPTTRQIDTESTTFVPGRIVTREDTTRTYITETADSFSEFEWVIKPTKYIKPGTTYYFRSNDADSYSSGAVIFNTLTTSSDIPHDANTEDAFTGYNLYSEGKNLILEFRTRFDGHHHFDVQYSKDKTNWRTIKTIPGGDQHDYSTTLPNPPAGITVVYARIKMFDREGGVITSQAVKQEFRSNAGITTFSGVKDGMKVKFTLGVSSEYINPGFRIGKTNSTNSSFTPIVSIPGRGTASASKTWTVFDEHPAIGTNRYVLQYYKNGVINYKLIEVKFGLGGAAAITKDDVDFNIYPNPASSGKVSFDLKGYTGKTLTAKLTSLYGKQISAETFTVNAAGNYVLKTNASAGTYVLNVSGEGVAKSGKVLVQ